MGVHEALALGITSGSTPKTTDGAKGGPGQSYGSGGTPPPPAQAAQWPTPAAPNWKGRSEASITRADGKSRMDILQYRAEQGFTRPDLGLEYVLLQRAALGCKIGGGQHKIGGYTHADAEVIAATVAGMPGSCARSK